MTAPTATQPPPQQQPPAPPPPETPPAGEAMADAAIVAGLAVLLASAAATPPLAAIVALLTRPPQRRGEPRVSRPAATAVAKLALQETPPRGERIGEAGRQMQRLNIQRRAQFLLAAARRVTRQIGVDPSRETLTKALRAEQRFWRQHREASAKRTRAAAVADSAADQHGVPTKTGTVLGWAAEMDERTTAECRAANGKNWLVERPPRIGIPGTVHVHCRCRPVPPYRTKQLVGGGQLPDLPR